MRSLFESALSLPQIKRDRSAWKKSPLTVISASSHPPVLSVATLWARRELLYCLIGRDIRIRYKQTLLGVIWAVVQPLVSMVAFWIAFKGVAKVPTGKIPYPLFSYVGLLPWIFTSRAIAGASHCLVSNSELMTRVYFPRILLPMATVLANLADFLVALLLFLLVRLFVGPSFSLSGLFLLIPMVALMLLLSVGASLWLSALHVYFRDIGHALTFFLQLWLFVTPVAYPFDLVPPHYRWLASLNPLSGVVEGFRTCLLGTPWVSGLMLSSLLSSTVLLISGAALFHRLERKFADYL